MGGEEQRHVVLLAIGVKALELAVDELRPDLDLDEVPGAVANGDIARALAEVRDLLLQVLIVADGVVRYRAGESVRVSRDSRVAELLAGEAQRDVDADGVNSLSG